MPESAGERRPPSPPRRVRCQPVPAIRPDRHAVQEGAPAVPSTPGQWELARLLADELRSLGAEQVRVSDTCMVYAPIPANAGDAGAPAVGFIAHVDTSPAVSGANVRPIVHANYQGGDIVLPGDRAQVITVAQQSGAARADRRRHHHDRRHDAARVGRQIRRRGDHDDGRHAGDESADAARADRRSAFTADEEIGVGIENVRRRAGFGADCRVHGGRRRDWRDQRRDVERAAGHGDVSRRERASGHGQGRDGERRSTRSPISCRICPATCARRRPKGASGFVHPYAGTLDVETSSVKVILRDFDVDGPSGLDAKERLMRELAADAAARCPGVRVTVEVVEQYHEHE